MKKLRCAVVALFAFGNGSFAACGGKVLSTEVGDGTRADAPNPSGSLPPSPVGTVGDAALDGHLCKLSGESCARAAECCVGSCSNGKCSDVCVRDNQPCTFDGDCCSGRCDVVDGGARVCVPLRIPEAMPGEPCTTGVQCLVFPLCVSSDAGESVCAQRCNPSGDGCGIGSDCCGGRCDRPDGGSGVCVGGCAPDLYGCRHDAECCSGSCSATDAGVGTCLSR